MGVQQVVAEPHRGGRGVEGVVPAAEGSAARPAAGGTDLAQVPAAALASAWRVRRAARTHGARSAALRPRHSVEQRR